MWKSEDKHRAIIMEEFFSGSSIFPLSIVLVDSEEDGVVSYQGVHFIDTITLLSLVQRKPLQIQGRFDENGNLLTSVEEWNKTKIKFESWEISVWCENIISGITSAFMQCDLPYIYRDAIFKDFERIAMLFPGYEAYIDKKAVSRKPNQVEIIKLDRELLRLRQSLL